MALRASDPRWFGRTMNAKMGLAEVDPHYADGIVGTGLQHDFPTILPTHPMPTTWVVMILQ